MTFWIGLMFSDSVRYKSEKTKIVPLPLQPLISFNRLYCHTTCTSIRVRSREHTNPTQIYLLPTEWLHSSVGRALQQHCRIPLESSEFFQVSIIDNCLNCPNKCEDYSSFSSISFLRSSLSYYIYLIDYLRL